MSIELSVDDELATVYARMSGLLLSQETVQTMVEFVTDPSTRAIRSATACAVSLMDEQGRRTTTGSIDPAVAAENLELAAWIALADSVGGDAYDYDFAQHSVTFAIYDAMGHGMGAGLVAAAALSASRSARRARLPVGLPASLGQAEGRTARARLEPGDWLVLSTDGVVEARAADGGCFGEPRLIDFLTREVASGDSPPETVRRLC